MSLSLDEFIDRLTSSRLMSAQEIRAFLDRLPAAKRPRDSHGFAKELVQSERLSLFQVSSLAKGRTEPLVLGRYAIIDKLGAGAMGEIYKAVRQDDGQTVALKVLSPKATNNAETVHRFHREIEILSRLRHPNVVNAQDSGDEAGTHFLVMDYVEGSNLARYVKTNGTLNAKLAADYILQAASGLEHAHQQGVVHRDVKPSNLIVDINGIVKILDLGLARLSDGDGPQLTQSGNVMGTIDYMAPEQAFDTKNVDLRVDIYSLGCSFYYLLSGRPVFDGPTLIRKAKAHQKQPPPSIVDMPGADAELDRIFQKMLAKNPDERYASMQAVVNDLENAGYVSNPVPQSPEIGVPIGMVSSPNDAFGGSSTSAFDSPEFEGDVRADLADESILAKDSLEIAPPPTPVPKRVATDYRLILASIFLIALVMTALLQGWL